MVAMALACRPRLLIADEPTSALDATLATETMELLNEVMDPSTAMLVVSHDIALCLHYCERTMVMRAGRIVEQGLSTDLRTQARHPYTIGLMQCVPTMASYQTDRLRTLRDVMAAET
jgi:ABC-type dipeptide/oligopeptide/nickel transport system ATPase component